MVVLVEIVSKVLGDGFSDTHVIPAGIAREAVEQTVVITVNVFHLAITVSGHELLEIRKLAFFLALLQLGDEDRFRSGDRKIHLLCHHLQLR